MKKYLIKVMDYYIINNPKGTLDSLGNGTFTKKEAIKTIKELKKEGFEPKLTVFPIMLMPFFRCQSLPNLRNKSAKIGGFKQWGIQFLKKQKNLKNQLN